MNRFPSKTNALRFLRGAGLDVQTILDVGVMTETRELIEVFPDKRHLLFEPVTNFHNLIKSNYKSVDHELCPVAVSNKEGIGSLRIDHEGGAKRVTHARLIDEPTAGDEVREVRTVSLDSFLSGRQEPGPYLLKIDVDGHELEILDGARKTLERTACVVIEVAVDTFLARSQFMIDAGFFLSDMVDLCYYRGTFAQSDLIFVRNELRSLFNQPNEGFDWHQWRNFSWYENGIDWLVH